MRDYFAPDDDARAEARASAMATIASVDALLAEPRAPASPVAPGPARIVPERDGYWTSRGWHSFAAEAEERAAASGRAAAERAARSDATAWKSYISRRVDKAMDVLIKAVGTALGREQDARAAAAEAAGKALADAEVRLSARVTALEERLAALEAKPQKARAR